MAAGLQSRSYVLQVRTGSDGRTLVGRAVPYGETTDIPGGKERFVRGAFARQIANGQLGKVKLFESHHSRMEGMPPIGKTLSLQERADGLYGVWPLFSTSRADDALELVRSGEVTGLSIGFNAVPGGTRRGDDGAYERHQAELDHIVLTHEPAYATAGVMAVRRSGARPIDSYRTYRHRSWLLLQRVTVPSRG